MIPSWGGEHPGQATASQPTTWRTLEAIADDDVALTRMEAVLGEVRAHVWGLPDGAPPVLAQAGEPLCVSIWTPRWPPSTRKRTARRSTDKHTFSYHPDLAFVDRGDGTGEALAGLLRPGNAGSNTAADHIELLDAALAGLPHVGEDVDVVVRGDVGYAVTDFLAHARARDCRFSVGFEITEAITTHPRCGRGGLAARADCRWRRARPSPRRRAHRHRHPCLMAGPNGAGAADRAPAAPRRATDHRRPRRLPVHRRADRPGRGRHRRARASPPRSRRGPHPRALTSWAWPTSPAASSPANAARLQLTLIELNLLAWTQALNWTASSPVPNPSGCAISWPTPPPASPAAPGAPPCAWPPTGAGPPTC